ncbi:MAG: hypothetical protein B7Y02_10485 [Rhodobacterales bacterium 17-64-5]|nr:MAG: hypothetical protein B7Y02_10485 [Rhodobacterales bacterium 17-64-5]
MFLCAGVVVGDGPDQNLQSRRKDAAVCGSQTASWKTRAHRTHHPIEPADPGPCRGGRRRCLPIDIAGGEIFGLPGHNGAGKSATIQRLIPLSRPASGTATVAGHDIGTDPLKMRRRIAMSPKTCGCMTG